MTRLSKQQREVLGAYQQCLKGFVPPELNTLDPRRIQGIRRTLRALADKGLVDYDGGSVAITEAGKQAIAEEK